jgi:hypothetical protein
MMPRFFNHFDTCEHSLDDQRSSASRGSKGTSGSGRGQASFANESLNMTSAQLKEQFMLKLTEINDCGRGYEILMPADFYAVLKAVIQF